MADYYSILGLPQGASKDAIKKAYRRLAMQYHPDKNSAADARNKFIQITQAYNGLMEGKRFSSSFVSKPRTQATPKSSPPKSPGKAADEKRHEQMIQRHEQMMKKFMEMKRSLGTGAVLEKNRKKEFAAINLEFAFCVFVFAGGIILPFISGKQGLLVLSFPLGLGAGIKLFWKAGRRKMRADMLYAKETYFSLNELREFFSKDRLGTPGGLNRSRY
ncbi:hypothetical protein BH11BAC7_BH11BAC7_01320 [soil metagenome]